MKKTNRFARFLLLDLALVLAGCTGAGSGGADRTSPSAPEAEHGWTASGFRGAYRKPISERGSKD